MARFGQFAMSVASTTVAVASLVAAIAAIVIAALSAFYTRRQAVAAAGIHEIERARRLGERRPRLSGKVERVGQGTARLVVTLESDGRLAGMDINIPPGQGITFDRNVFGVYPVRPGDAALAAFVYEPSGESAGIDPRGSASWKVELTEKHVNDLRVEATCHGLTGERWDSVLIMAPVQPDISKTVW